MADQQKRLQVLLDKQDIYELVCRYCRGVDRMDKELTMSCFWPGAIDIHLGKFGNLHTGTAQDFFDQEWEGFKEFTASQHYICNHLCEVDGDKAFAETYQFSFYWKKPGDEPTRNAQNSNRYVDRFEKRNGEWRITHRTFIRNFSLPIQPVGFPTVENGWPSLSQSRNDLAYSGVNGVSDWKSTKLT
ncbi:hypothetical protein LTR72_008437 [Exophiala xenobiotica]|nr:hypothetical protein LTR72_008437 [Exophiala xenobiotica]KAK5291588.1 hypothetical protein LTR14_006162 [Exophiala xenobiotica]